MMINPVRFNHTPDITVVNQKQFNAHYSLYENYVKSINEITSELNNLPEEMYKKANTTNGYFRGLKRGETYALAGVILHELYFRNLGGLLKEANKCIKETIERDFGSYDKWLEDFKATAKASRGWVVLAWDQRTNRLRNLSLDTHDDGMVVLALPLLVLDMYEHAYFLQYAENKVAYIDAFVKNIHWDIVEQRMRYWGIACE